MLKLEVTYAAGKERVVIEIDCDEGTCYLELPVDDARKLAIGILAVVADTELAAEHVYRA